MPDSGRCIRGSGLGLYARGPESLPGSRVTSTAPRWVLERQHILARPVGPSTSTSFTMAATGSNSTSVTYDELPPEYKERYDNLKAQFEADLIGSFERTRHHGVRHKGYTVQGALDGIDLSVPSEERTRALRQEINYMVAHSLHRQSESPVSSLEHIAVRVVQEIMNHKYSLTGPQLGSHPG